MANIVIGKCSKAVNFMPDKWGAIGGDNEAPTLFLSLAKQNPQNTYYMISRSNFSKMPEEFKREYPNIIDVWEEYDKPIKQADDAYAHPYKWMTEHNVHIDTGVFYSGPAGTASIPNVIKHPDGTYYTALVCFKNYAAPIHDFCNRSGIKYLHLLVDPRYFPYRCADLFNRPAKILSQFEGSATYRHIISYENLTMVPHRENITYNEIEKVFLIGRQKLDFSKLEKTTKMLIVLNEGKNRAPSRGPDLKKYVLDNFPDVKVYGDWSEDWVKRYPENFQGPKKFIELEPVLKSVKYTFIIPINRGWVTAKIWEMLHYGIIPFMHPWYDEQKHIPVPDFIRVKNPEDLKEKIALLEANPSMYKSLLNDLQKLLLDSYYDGSRVNNIITDAFKEIGVKNV